MNYEERCNFTDEVMSKLRKKAMEENNGSFNGVIVSIDFEKKIPAAMRREMSETILRCGLVSSIIEFTNASLTVQFMNKTANQLLGDISNYHIYHPDIWDENYVVDEYQSVKWNREQVAAHNEEELEAEKTSREYIRSLELMWELKVMEYRKDELGDNISDKALRVIFNKAYEDGHAYGYHQVESDYQEEVDMVIDFLREKGV